jgi:hypothetical protein
VRFSNLELITGQGRRGIEEIDAWRRLVIEILRNYRQLDYLCNCCKQVTTNTGTNLHVPRLSSCIWSTRILSFIRTDPDRTKYLAPSGTMRLGERRSLRTSHLYSRKLTIHFFRLCWVVIIIWGELGVFFWSLSSCRWPSLKNVNIDSFHVTQLPEADN